MNISPLPLTSIASLSKGMWYVFHDEGHVIRAWGSSWTGIERVYFDEELVTRSNHLKRLENIRFKRNGHVYQIQCTNSNIQKWQVKCTFLRDGEKVSVLKFRRQKIFELRPSLLHLFAGLGVGAIGGLLSFPTEFGLIFIFLSLFLTLLSTAKTEHFSIDQETS